MHARAPNLNLTGGAQASGREADGGPHDRRRQPWVREGGELTGDDAGHGEVGRGHGWTQRRVAVRVEVVDVTGAAWFVRDEEARRRSFGRRWLRPFPAAKEAGKRG